MSTLQKDMRVRILVPQLGITHGVIYRHQPASSFPWCVRPDGWSEKRVGVAFKSEELKAIGQGSRV